VVGARGSGTGRFEGTPLSIHPTAIIGSEARIHASADIGPFAVVGPRATIGAGTKLCAHAAAGSRVIIGARNILNSFCVVGGQPQVLADDSQDSQVFLGDDNHFGVGVTVNRGTRKGGGLTLIGNRNSIHPGAHVAHDCSIGDDCLLGPMCLLAGHVRVEPGARIDARTGVHHWATIGAYSWVRAASGISRDVPPFMIVGGSRGEVLGVNVEALRARGVGEDALTALGRAFRLVWQSSLPKPAALAGLQGELGHVPEIRALVEFLRASDQGRMGRRLERNRSETPPRSSTGKGGQMPPGPVTR
jgi:UDP-N-acetylglucosamine acyltransferase